MTAVGAKRTFAKTATSLNRANDGRGDIARSISCANSQPNMVIPA
jgi:hypothetical protein